MDALGIIDEHLIIRETVGYDVLKEVAIEDMPTVLNFLKIVYNYNRMKRVDKEEEPEWSDPMLDHLDREEKESEWQRRRRLDVMREAKKEERRKEKELIEKILADRSNAAGFDNFDPDRPKYCFQGFTYVLNRDLTHILEIYVSKEDIDRHWLMEDLKERAEYRPGKTNEVGPK